MSGADEGQDEMSDNQAKISFLQSMIRGNSVVANQSNDSNDQ